MKLITNVIYKATAYCTRIYDVEDIITEEEKEILKRAFNGEYLKFTQEEWKQYNGITLKLKNENAEFEEYEDEIYFEHLLDEKIEGIEE